MQPFRVVLAFIALGTMTSACASQAPPEVRQGQASFTALVELPPPAKTGTMSLEEAIQRRRTTYEFLPDAVPVADLGQLLWAAQGMTSETKRAAPSAGALYPLELYVLTDQLMWHYLPVGHRVEERSAVPWRAALQRAAFGQDVLARSPAVIVIAAVPRRTQLKYGALADSYVQREAGHAAQNILLEATARGLAAVPLGGVDPAAAAHVLALPPGTFVLYLIPIGRPSAAGP